MNGSANIVVTPDHVEFGSAMSEPFSPEAKAALAELRRTIGELLNGRGRDGPAPKNGFK